MRKNLNYQKLSKEEKGLAEKENEKFILEKLIKASDELIEFRDETPNYDNILQTIIAISGARYAAINIFDDDYLDFKTVAISGKKEHLQDGLKMLGFNVVNMHWKEDPIRAEKTKNQAITRFMRLHELTGVAVSKNVIRLIQKTLGIGETFVVKISKESKVLGDFTLLYQKGETMINDKFVDLYSHQVGMFLDRQSSKNLLRENEARHRALISNISDVITIIDAKGILTYLSPNCERWFGWQPHELIGTSGWSTVHPDDLERIQKEFFSLLQQDKSTKTVEYQYKSKNGTYKYIELTATNLIKDPIINGVLLNCHDITKRRQAEKDLQESAELYHNLVLRLPDGVYKSTHEGKFVNINPAMVKILGYQSEEELLAIDIKTQLYFEPTDRESLVLQEKLEEKGVYRLKRKDGAEVWVEDHGWYILDENGNIIFHEGVIRDITDRKYAEDALRKSEQQFRSVLETVSLIGIMLDSDGKITLCNDFLLNLTGWKREDVIQKNWFELFLPPEIRTDIQIGVFQKSINEGKVAANFENEIITLGGERRLIAWNNTILHDHLGAVSGVASIGEDITDRKTAEAEIKFKTEQLLELNAEKDKFFSIIAHDLRSPLSGFLGLTQVMAEELPNLTMSQVQDIAVTMSKSATNLYRLLENLLQWSQIQQGATPFNPEVVQLNLVLDESIEMIQESAKNKGIVITNNIPDGLAVLADTNLIQTVIRNLVSNAVKFTPKGGKVNLSAKVTKDKNIEISICDTGIGMSKIMVDNLFRIDIKTTRKGTEGEPSTGLGLILCKEFIEKLGGRIGVESEVGVGSKFSFTIPLNVVPEQTSDKT